jgi:hypothetical protein
MNIFRRRLLKSLSLALVASAPAWAQPARAPIRIALIEGLSGPFGNTGEAVYRNLAWAIERVNARGGVKLPGGARPLALERYDSKGQNEEALAALRSAIDDGVQFVVQGNSSSVAAALIDAINKHNEREPGKRVLFLNYSAVDPVLTNEKCSFWHFRFDAHADMRMAALMEVIRDDKSVKSVYLIGQDYSFGQAVLREARRQLGVQRPDMQVVGDELHPVGRVKDFLPYAAKIKASGAQAVITGNWGNDLTLLVKAAGRGLRRALLHLLRQCPGCTGRHRRCRDWPGGGRGGLAAQRARGGERGVLPLVSRALSEARGRLRTHAHATAGRGAGAGDGEEWVGDEHGRRGRAAGAGGGEPERARRAHACGRPSVPAAAGGGPDGPARRARRQVRRRGLGATDSG